MAAHGLQAPLPPQRTPRGVLSEQEVLREERRHVAHHGGLRWGDGPEGLAVSFSGGGVRSAAFCTGVLWALGEAGLLRRVTHISSVSGGTVAASSFASFVVARSRKPPQEAEVDQWYRSIVADLTCRCQKNAGYLVSFAGDLWRRPSDNSSSMPRAFDGVFMLLIVFGVLVAAPTVFTVFYIIPLSILIEAYFGNALRSCFCSGQWEIGFWCPDLLTPGLTLITLAVVLTSALLLLLLVKPLVPRSDRPPFGRFLAWRSLMQLCSRWIAFLALTLAAVALVYAAQASDYREHSCHPRPGAPLAGTPGLLFWKLVLGTGGGLLVSVAFRAAGCPWVWQLFLVLLLPLCFLLPASFVLQWCVFGPVTGQPLVVPVLGARLWGEYSAGAWRAFAGASLAMAISGLPAFQMLHRFVHQYFRRSMMRAFYHDGRDVLAAEVARCPWVPVLLFGATLNGLQKPTKQDADPHSIFVLSQHAVGCERTGFLPAPQWLTLSKCMALSSAAVDGMVLTRVARWHLRLLVAMLNLTQGDWLRFDAGQWAWHRVLSRGQPWAWLGRRPLLASLLDGMPAMLLWACFYALLLLLMNAQAQGTGVHTTAFRWYRRAATGLLALFLGVFSFFPHVRTLSWLQASPLVRQIHMFMLSQMMTPEPPMHLYLTDGGVLEDLGLVQLLRRRRRWILSTDAGDDPEGKLLDLRNAIALARTERLCSIYSMEDARSDLEAVLEKYAESREPFLRLGVKYGSTGDGDPAGAEVGQIFHVRMRLLDPENRPVPLQPEVLHGEVGRDLRTRPDAGDGLESPSWPGAPASAALQWAAATELEAMPPTAPLQRSAPDAPARPPHRGEVGGMCCACCHRCTLGTVASCGAFPNTHTCNQFFTPVMWANFCRLGYELSRPTIAALCKAQQDGLA